MYAFPSAVCLCVSTSVSYVHVVGCNRLIALEVSEGLKIQENLQIIVTITKLSETAFLTGVSWGRTSQASFALSVTQVHDWLAFPQQTYLIERGNCSGLKAANFHHNRVMVIYLCLCLH